MRRSFPRSFRWCLLAAGTLASVSAFADSSTPSFNNLTNADYTNVVKELSSNFSYSSQTSAASLGGLGGFEVGFIGGVTDTPNIEALVKENNSSYHQKQFPHAGVVGRLGLPKGLTVEATILPKITASDLSISNYGGALMWTLTDVVWKKHPIDIAVKGFFNKTTLGYTQSIQNSSTGNQPVNAAIDYGNTTYGAELLVSHTFFSILTPYVGAGYVKAKGTLDINAATAPNASFFASGQTSAEADPTSAMLMGGLDIRLFFVSLGAEYKKVFDTSSYSARLSFRF